MRLAMQRGMKYLDRRIAGEGRFASQHLEEDAAEGEDVGRRARRLAADLLRRHVPRGAEQRAVPGGLAEGGRIRGEPGAVDPRQSEVEHLGVVLCVEHDVLGLEVAMHDADRVRRGDRPRDLCRNAPRPGRRQRARPQPLAQAASRQELHDDVGRIVGADVMHDDDVGMAEGRHRPRLASEAAQSFTVGGDLDGQDFDGDLAPEPRIARPINLPHPAGAERRDDLVRAQTKSGSQSHDGRAEYTAASRKSVRASPAPGSAASRARCPSGGPLPATQATGRRSTPMACGRPVVAAAR